MSNYNSNDNFTISCNCNICDSSTLFLLFQFANELLLMIVSSSCLLFLIEPLLSKNNTVSFSFYTKMLENIKSSTDAQCPDSEEANSVRTFLIIVN